MATRIGVDVGGTFTDLIFYDDETGEVRVGKEPTTPAEPGGGRARRDRGGAAGASASARRSTSCTGRPSGSTRCSSARARSSGCSRTRASATSSRSAAATAAIRTTSSGAAASRWCRAACASASPSGCVRTATVHGAARRGDVARAVEAFAGGGRRSASRSRSSTAYANPAHELAAERALRELRVRGRDLALAPRLGRVPRVRADHARR